MYDELCIYKQILAINVYYNIPTPQQLLKNITYTQVLITSTP